MTIAVFRSIALAQLVKERYRYAKPHHLPCSERVCGMPIVVAYSTKDGTAFAGNNDYECERYGYDSSHQTSVDVNVTINGDYTVEPNESFDINISNGQGVTMGTVLRSVTISDDDNRTLTLSGTTVTGGIIRLKTSLLVWI